MTELRPSMRKSDLFWLILSSRIDPEFGNGVPWNLNPGAFERLQQCGMVAKTERVSRKGIIYDATVTQRGARRLAEIRDRIRANRQRQAEEAAA